MIKEKFELLKRTYPVSQIDRYCDGYDFIMKNTTPEERKKMEIDEKKLQCIIKKGEKYIYQVAKEKDKFKVMCLCFTNYGIIREKIFKHKDN